jgi:hypothetical protein
MKRRKMGEEEEKKRPARRLKKARSARFFRYRGQTRRWTRPTPAAARTRSFLAARTQGPHPQEVPTQERLAGGGSLASGQPPLLLFPHTPTFTITPPHHYSRRAAAARAGCSKRRATPPTPPAQSSSRRTPPRRHPPLPSPALLPATPPPPPPPPTAAPLPPPPPPTAKPETKQKTKAHWWNWNKIRQLGPPAHSWTAARQGALCRCRPSRGKGPGERTRGKRSR